MNNLTEQIDRLFAENRGAEAEKLLEQALAEAYENQYFLDAVPILNELIGYCRETSQVERSYQYAEEVQEILQNLGLEGSLHHGTTLLNIANAYRAGGRLEDSLEKYSQVAEIYKELLQEEESNIISLIDENGAEVDFEYMDCIEYEGKEYLALLPVEEEDNSVVILEVEPVDDDNENYISVDDEATLQAVYGIFKERFKDVLTFED